MTHIIEMEHIYKSFPGVQALTDVELHLEKGEVHGLIGENGAGKSTLMNILSGVLIPDRGNIYVGGEKVSFKTPHDALSRGISMIHQEIELVPELTVAENIWIGREKNFSRFGSINRKLLNAATIELMNQFGISVNPNRPVSSLNVAEMQLVEILRAVSYKSDVIIMDEPTSSLTAREVEILYSLVRKLKQLQVSFIFISHKIEELLQICDRITVMRDSRYIDTVPAESTEASHLVTMMVGRDLDNFFQKKKSRIGEVVLRVQDLSREGVFTNINFELHQGEVLGIAGLVGAGRSEIVQSIFGIDEKTEGKVFIGEEEVNINSPADAINCGMAMVTEDRGQSGLVLGMPVSHNITLTILKRLSRSGILNLSKEDEVSTQLIRNQKIKVADHQQPVNQLSGGNQQKVVLSKWLLTNPRILILDEPTRGIDVGSKSEIYHQMNELTSQGLGIIMISSEMPEILAMSDRILVIRDGRMVFECSREQATQHLIMGYAFGHSAENSLEKINAE